MGLELSHLMQISKLLLKNEESITLEEVANYEKFWTHHSWVKTENHLACESKVILWSHNRTLWWNHCWVLTNSDNRKADLEIVLIRDDVCTSSDYRVVSLKLVCGPFPLTRWLSCSRECALSPPHPIQSCSLSPTCDCFGSRCSL